MPYPTAISYSAANGRERSVTKADPLPTLETCSGLIDGQVTATTAGVPLSATPVAVSGVCIQNDGSEDIFYGSADGQHWRIVAGGDRSIPIDDLSKVYVRASATSAQVNYTGFVP